MRSILQGLPDDVRSSAIVLPNGEVMWTREDARAALGALTATGARILGLDLRSDGPGSTARAGVATEIPWADCSAAAGDDGLRQALVALDVAEGEHPQYPWVLVTWERGVSLPKVALSDHEDGWWAECVICGAWVSMRNPDRRSAEMKFGRHLQQDHPTVVSSD